MNPSVRPLRVLHTLPDLDLGGGQVLLLRLIEAMRSLEDAEHVVCAFAGGVMLSTYRQAGVRTVISPAPTAAKVPGALAGVTRLVRSEKIDVVHTNNTCIDACTGQLAAALTGRRSVNTFHAAILPRAELRLGSISHAAAFIPEKLSRARERLRSRLHASFVRRAETCIAVSSIAAASNARHCRVDPGRVRVIHPGLPASAYRPVSPVAAAALRRSLGVAGAQPLILNIGRLEHGKGQHLLVPMMRRLRATWPETHLLIAGEGEERGALTESISRQGVGAGVTLLGHRSDVRELLAASDLLISASLCEGFGLVLLEAMAAGKPVVALHTPAYDDFTIDGRTALMVHQAEPDALAAAVARLAHDADLSRAIGRRAEEAARGFGVERAARNTLAVYRDVLRGAARDGVGLPNGSEAMSVRRSSRA